MDNYTTVYATLAKNPEMYGNGLHPEWPEETFVSGYLNTDTMVFEPTVARQNGFIVEIPDNISNMTICAAAYVSGWHCGNSAPEMIGLKVNLKKND